MSNTLGNSLKLTLFGESHGPYVGVVLDGLTPGIKIDEDLIREALNKRRPKSNLDTQRKEVDNFKIISGVFNSYSTGEPICLIIPNEDVKSSDYNGDIPRPSHSDYAAYVASNGYFDYRGGGHFSGRLTAPIVAIGAILIKALEDKGIKIGTHILKLGKVNDSNFSNFEKEMELLKNKDLALIDNLDKEVEEEILKAKDDLDSIGGVLQTAVINLPAGLGSPWFNSLEGKISNAMFSVGGVKGIEFGKGFEFASGYGSNLNDQFKYIDGKVITLTNNNGGINGGLSNGMPVIFNLVIKPTPSIAKKQQSINLKTKENVDLEIKGRHDPAIIKRLPIVINSLLAIVLADELLTKYGKDYLK